MEMRTRNRPKHYYAGSERVATRIGGGGLYAASVDPKLSDRAGMVFCQSPDQVNSRRLKENLSDCIANGLCTHGELLCDIMDIPSRLQADTAIDYTDFRRMIHDMRAIHHDEPDVYFYHSDHLGSASWITDNGGVAVQHLQYLPYGERYVDQRVTGYQERFTFTGKERDEETGYGYFGARYIDHELTTMWLSVDPMSDKYPGISPYAYCAWNPVKLVDPDGREISMDPYLIFNGKTNQLEIWDDNETPDDYSDDTFLGSFEAANNVVSGTRKWPDGIYPTHPDYQTSRHTHGTKKDKNGILRDSPNGSYGAGGIYQAADFYEDDGTLRSGMGVHAGRKNKGEHPWSPGRYTEGCIRTTSDCMSAIDQAIEDYGPLQRIIVRNNRGSNQSSEVNFIHPYTKWEFPTPTIWIDATYVVPVHSISIP